MNKLKKSVTPYLSHNTHLKSSGLLINKKYILLNLQSGHLLNRNGNEVRSPSSTKAKKLAQSKLRIGLEYLFISSQNTCFSHGKFT